MVRYLLLVVGLGLLCLVAVVLLSPSPEERLDRALSRLSPQSALAELDRMYEQGDRTPNLLLRRSELLMATGDVAEARRTLEDLAASPENAVLGNDQLAQLDVELGDADDAAIHLARAYALAPDPEQLDRLARLHELARRTDAELGLLEGANAATLTDRSARRMLELELERGDMAAAERLLRIRAETPGDSRAEMRGMLAELLIGSDRADEATLMTVGWLARDEDSTALGLAVERLIERGFIENAEVLARAAVASGVSAAHVVIPVFSIAGHGVEARALMRDWLAGHPRPDAAECAALLDYAKTMNDFSAVEGLLRRGEPADFDPAFVVGVLKGAYYRFGAAALPEFRRYLAPEVLSADPLFAAEIELAERDPADATRYLVLAAGQELAPWQTEAWDALARQVTSGPLHDRLVRARAVRTKTRLE
ncbi:MAG: hypothetical protein U1E59_17910 [Amaricoccus sp.]